MQTEMHEAKVHSLQVVSGRTVRLTFNLNENESLRDPGIVQRSMAAYTLVYPRFEGYTAEYVGEWLILTLMGQINNIGVASD